MPATTDTSEAPATLARAGSLIDPQALMAIKNLEMRAKIVVQGFWNGIHRSPYHGFSVEFTEYRQYVSGDDPRYLDWKLYARSDRAYIKKFEDETNLRCHLVVDNSRSMGYGSLGHTKAEYANTLAATLAQFLFQQGDGVGALTFDDQIREYLPARNRTGHLRHLMLALEKPTGGSATNLRLPLQRIAQIVRKRGMVILISDMLAPLEDLERDLVALTACGHEVMLFQIFDPAETTLSLDQSSIYLDVETNQELYIDPDFARKSYLKKFNEHNEAVGAICNKLGIGFHRCLTDQPLELALFDFMRDRVERGKKAKGGTGKRK